MIHPWACLRSGGKCCARTREAVQVRLFDNCEATSPSVEFVLRVGSPGFEAGLPVALEAPYVPALFVRAEGYGVSLRLPGQDHEGIGELNLPTVPRRKLPQDAENLGGEHVAGADRSLLSPRPASPPASTMAWTGSNG